MTGVTRDYTVEFARYDEVRVPGKPLGRQYRRDSRSAFYPYRRRAEVQVRSVEHARHTPIFDQGDVGSCTGEMEAGACATDPLFAPIAAAGLPLPDQALAVRFYSEATLLDGYPGYYKPGDPASEDTGSDGTAVSQAAKNDGYIAGYLHAATLADVLAALMDGPAGFGVDWWSSFDDPPASGIVEIGKEAYVRGGHEILARKVDVDRKLVGCDNSWGPGWGAAGSFWIPFAVLDQLLASDGDCVVPRSLSSGPPVPDPPGPGPAADPVLAAYLADGRLGRWAARRHYADTRYAAQQYLRLREAESE